MAATSYETDYQLLNALSVSRSVTAKLDKKVF